MRSVLLNAFLIFVFPLYAQAEDVKISTYYPSPEGDYKRIRTTDETTLAVNADNSNTARVAVGTDTVDTSSVLLAKGALASTAAGSDTSYAFQAVSRNDVPILRARNDAVVEVNGLRFDPDLNGGETIGNVLTAVNANGRVGWQAPAGQSVYINNRVQVFNFSDAGNGVWRNISYPGSIPNNVHGVILKTMAQANSWLVSTSVRAANLGEIEVARAAAWNNSDDAASDISFFVLPYDASRQFQAKWTGQDAAGPSGGRTATEGGNGGQDSEIWVIGYVA
jgi:hypothetical protein